MDIRAAQSETAAATSMPAGVGRSGLTILPGVGLTAAIATATFLLRLLPGLSIFSPMILAILIGMAIGNLWGTPAWAALGVKFSLRRILRTGIVLLGFQLMLRQIEQIALDAAENVVVDDAFVAQTQNGFAFLLENFARQFLKFR